MSTYYMPSIVLIPLIFMIILWPMFYCYHHFSSNEIKIQSDQTNYLKYEPWRFQNVYVTESKLLL
jgi:hypothetical protein